MRQVNVALDEELQGIVKALAEYSDVGPTEFFRRCVRQVSKAIEATRQGKTYTFDRCGILRLDETINTPKGEVR